MGWRPPHPPTPPTRGAPPPPPRRQRAEPLLATLRSGSHGPVRKEPQEPASALQASGATGGSSGVADTGVAHGNADALGVEVRTLLRQRTPPLPGVAPDPAILGKNALLRRRGGRRLRPLADPGRPAPPP